MPVNVRTRKIKVEQDKDDITLEGLEALAKQYLAVSLESKELAAKLKNMQATIEKGMIALKTNKIRVGNNQLSTVNFEFKTSSSNKVNMSKLDKELKVTKEWLLENCTVTQKQVKDEWGVIGFTTVKKVVMGEKALTIKVTK